jgi:hypothetical protein
MRLGSSPLRGEEQAVKREVRPVVDHEEWTRIIEDAEGQVITLKGFQVQDMSVDRPVTRKKIVENLARALGWEMGKLPVVRPLNLVGSGWISQLGGGSWRIGVPVDFLKSDPSDGRLEWPVTHKGHEYMLWCIEEFMRRTQPEQMAADFRCSVEVCLKDGIIYSCFGHGHPDAPQLV